MDALLIVGIVGLIVLGMRRWEAKTAALTAHRERRDATRSYW